MRANKKDQQKERVRLEKDNKRFWEDTHLPSSLEVTALSNPSPAKPPTVRAE
jgi:hypothetical protein